MRLNSCVKAPDKPARFTDRACGLSQGVLCCNNEGGPPFCTQYLGGLQTTCSTQRSGYFIRKRNLYIKYSNTINYVSKNDFACACDKLYLFFFCKSKRQNCAFVVYWNAVRNAEIRPYAVRELKLKQYARGRGFRPHKFCFASKGLQIQL